MQRVFARSFGVWLLIAVAAAGACERDRLGAGDGCTRSSECGGGLVCVEGACSASLAGLGNPGTVPMVMMGGEGMEPEPGADAGAALDGGGGTGAMTMAGTGGSAMEPPPAGAGGAPNDAGALGMPDVEPGFQP